MTVAEQLAAAGGPVTVRWEGKNTGVTREPLPTPSPAYIADKISGQYLWRCRNCSWHLLTDTDEALDHRCERKQVVRLGTTAKNALTALGITEESVSATLAAIGLPPTCGGCSRREAWLNRLDESLKLGEGIQLFKSAIGWK